ncbi:Cytochrome c oxidase assembly protein cox11, mitochondrial [Rhizina undulata]
MRPATKATELLFAKRTTGVLWTCGRCSEPLRIGREALKRRPQFFSNAAVLRANPTPVSNSNVAATAGVASAAAAAGRRAPDYRAVYRAKNQNLLYYTLSLTLATLTLAYAAVPLYRAICQRTGFGGIPITDISRFTPDKLVPVQGARRLRITFNASVSDILEWKFTPQQREVRVKPGETALAFYTATNMSKEDIIGVATYSVTPGQVAPYFSKIQCFCFEEQKLNAGETVDMPVFFFIDPDFLADPQMKGIDTVTLNYTFFKAKYDDNGVIRPLP